MSFATAPFRDPMTARSRLRATVEKLLPWYSAMEAREHDAKTEAIRLRSIAARREGERQREALATAVQNAVRALRT